MLAKDLSVGDKIVSTHGLVYTVLGVDTMSGGRVKLTLIGIVPWSPVVDANSKVKVA